MQNISPTLKATSFNDFSLSVLDATSNKALITLTDEEVYSQKAQLLVEYLLFSGKEAATFEELIEILWPGEGPADPLASLRILIHRARVKLRQLEDFTGAELILRQEKTYLWNKQLPLKRDNETFDKLYHKSRCKSGEERLDILLEAEQLYKGHFLPKRSQNQWVMVLDAYYHSKYLAICEEAITLLEKLERNWDIVDLCKKAVTIDPYAERIHVAFIKALTAVGSHGAALEHYKYVTEMFLNEFGITPSKELKEVYLNLQNQHELETNISVICQSLAEEEESQGAYFMEYEAFRLACQLKARESVRTGQNGQLILITVLPAAGKHPGQRSQRTCMERLGKVIKNSLRMGDFYTRYSVLQYLVLAQNTSSENSQKVINRLQHNFNLAYPGSGYLLQCSPLPILPKNQPFAN